MSYLQNIDRLSGDNLGGLLLIRVARKADIKNIPDDLNGVITEDIEFMPGKSWAIWRITQGTAIFRSSGNDENFNNSLSFVVSKNRELLNYMLKVAINDEHVVLFDDANGNQILFGTISDPVRFRIDHSTSNRNQYDCEFYSEGADNWYFYNGDISGPIGETLPAIITVNGQYVASLQPGQTINFDTDFDFTFEIVGT